MVINNTNGLDSLLSKINQTNLPRKLDTKQNEKVQNKSFEDVLKETLKDVNNLQGKVKDSIEKMLSGEIKDINQVMNAIAEADIAFDLMIEIKNKLIDAYKELERMNI